MAYNPEDDAIEPVYPLESLIGGRFSALKAVPSLVREVTKRRVKNVVVPSSKDPVLGRERYPSSPDAVTHAYRSMSPEEFAHARQVGRLLKDPRGIERKWDTNKKYWSEGDDAGLFGRQWKTDPGKELVRAPVGKVRGNNWGVKTKDLERLNRETGQYEPVKLRDGGEVKSGKRSSASRGDGCAQRGRTRGKVR